MRLFVQILLFLMLADDGVSTNVYARYMFTPLVWVRAVLFRPLLQLRVCDLLLGGILVVATFSGGAKIPMVKPMRRALVAAAAITVWSLVHGLVTGGDPRAAGWQVYLLFALLMATFAFAAVFRTAEQFRSLAWSVVAAGLYHAIMAIVFYAVFVRTGRVSVAELGDYLSTHDDSVLWCVGVCYLLLGALLLPSGRTRLAAALGLPLLLIAMQLNHRRLVWISLIASFAALYALLPPSRVKRQTRRFVRVVAPLCALYVWVGVGRPEAIFRPLRAFQTVAISEDTSTLARNAENLGLIATAQQGWLLGTGWGHRYQEVTAKYQIHFFKLWPYVPHNSVLGLLAYTGYLGFVGFWLIIPTAVFLLARLSRLAVRREDQFVGLLGVAQLVICADQWYGDMGSFSVVTDYTLATCLAVALRIPIAAGVWPSGRPGGTAPASAGEAGDVAAGAGGARL